MIATLNPPRKLGDQLDRAAALLEEIRRVLLDGDTEGELRGVTAADIAFLLKIAVEYPEATNLEALDMIQARLRRAERRSEPGCGGCWDDCRGQIR
jgi:hypothetical protein